MKYLAHLCKPRQSVFDRNRRDVVLDLTDLLQDRIDPDAFFEENYFTDGMRRLLREAFRRFAGQSAQGVFVLTQAMGDASTGELIDDLLRPTYDSGVLQRSSRKNYVMHP